MRQLEIAEPARQPGVPGIINSSVGPNQRRGLRAGLDLPKRAMLIHGRDDERLRVFLYIFFGELGRCVDGYAIVGEVSLPGTVQYL